MIGRIESSLRRIGRTFSRSEWMTRLLRLPVSHGPTSRAGLLMIQIDGLAHRQLQTALDKGEMPFLQRLLGREHYRLHSFYSGLPSSTPAVQAELFYGVRTAMPAFAFRDCESGDIVRMYEPDAAEIWEKRLEQQSSGSLLKGGSAYSNIFTGGAREAHFCPSSLGWGPSLRLANPLVPVILLFANLYSFLRIGVLLLLELVISIVDFFRGLVEGRNFGKELKFIPTRVGICIMLRELCVIGAKIDLHRGLPVIHVNLLGYDEQSHRRGPDSAFAHWTLKGIDDAVARLWRAAMRAHLRHYEVWIYSDHGQCKAIAYDKVQGYDIDKAVCDAFAELRAITIPVPRRPPESVQTHRVRLLGGRRFQRLFSVFARANGNGHGEEVPRVSALGPVGFIYSPWELGERERVFLARELAHRHRVPAVVIRDARDRLLAFTGNGQYVLPEQLGVLCGDSHPFLEPMKEDLAVLCRHACSGDLVILGWRQGVTPQTFATENGSHAGITPDETEAFCLLPRDAPLQKDPRPWLRPLDLRDAALCLLGRAEAVNTARKAARRQRGRSLRVMTYNVHSCLGMDGKLSPERIARVIARCRADVVALQEIDVGRQRSGGEDQAEAIARYLEMDYHFHPAIHLEEEKYGDAILTRLPVETRRAGALPGLGPTSKAEPRGALWVTVDLEGQPVHIINTHLGLSARERLLQAQALLGSDWLGHEDCRGPAILCGDFNAIPSSRVCRELRRRLNDAQMGLKHHRPRNTYFSRLPTARIDHVFVSPDIEVTAIDIPRYALTLVASDHLPLVAELRIPGGDK